MNIIYGYCRVSTFGQSKGNSLQDQEDILRAAGATFIFTEYFTGTKSDRPEFQKLLNKLETGDTIVVTKLDRLARNTQNAISLIQSLVDREITVNILNMGIANNSAVGKLMITILAGFAEFERDLIVERTMAGKAIARTKEGFREGRPLKFTKEQIKLAVSLLKAHSYREVERMTGISSSTLNRARRMIKK